MSILFSETSQKKAPKLPKKPLGKAFPHLSIPSHSSSIPSIFSEFPDPPPPPSLFRPTHSLPDPIPKHETIKGNHIIQQFIDSDPLLKSHCDLVPNTNIRLSLSEKHKSSLESALKVEFSLKSVQRIVDSIAKRSQSRQADFLRDFRSLSHHKSGSIDRRTHLSRYKALHTQLISRIHFMLDGFLTLSLKIGGIVRLIESNLDTDLLVRFSTSDIEKHLAGFETTDREYLILEQAIARERRDLTTKQHYGDYGQCFELVQKLFDPLTASYPDTGEIDSLFGHITEQNSDETLQNRLKTVLQRPETAGKVALALAHDSMKDKVKNNKTLFMAAFLMAARYLFSQIYLRKSFHQCNPEFLRRIAEMRKFPPIVFGSIRDF
jgi:hypothetical protein